MGASTVIPIRVESDVTRASELAHDVAATAPFSSAEQNRIAASVSRVARVLLHSPQQGFLAVAILREAEASGIAIVVRFVGEGQGGPANSSVGDRRKGRAVVRRPRRIEEIGGEFDRIEKSEAGRDLLVTLVQWRRKGEKHSSASAGANPGRKSYSLI